MSASDPTAPLFTIRQVATPAEVAAITTVLLGRGAGSEPRKPRTLWNSPARQVRPRLSPGPGAWRASGLPR